MKHTPDKIEKLEPNEVFVFGSNESGIHGAGAAKLARDKFGAQMGVGFGMQGHSFAIPTKDWEIKTLPLEVIRFYVNRFIAYTKGEPYRKFLVTKVGCGLVAYTAAGIKPLFKECIHLSNVILPEEFK